MFEKHKNWLLFLFLGILFAALPYWELILDSSKALLFRDLSQVILPNKRNWLDGVLELGRIPHWSPYQSGGKNFLVDPAVGPLSPYNLFLLVFSFFTTLPRALSFSILLSHQIIFVGFFLFFTSLKIRPAIAFVGAASMAMTGFAMSSDNLFHVLTGQVAVGFFLYYIRGKTLLSIFGASASLAWPILCGDPQFSYILGLSSLLFISYGRESILRLLKVFALAVLLAAPQIFPTFFYLMRDRSFTDGSSPFDSQIWSLNPIRILEFVFPLLFGSKVLEFSANSLVPEHGFPFIFSNYLGMVTILVFLLFLWRAGKKIKEIRAKSILKVAGASLLFLIPMGSFAPFPIYKWMASILPLWGTFRYPERLTYWILLVVVVIATTFLDKMFRVQRLKVRNFSIAILAAFVSLGAMAYFLSYTKPNAIVLSLVVVSILSVVITAPISRSFRLYSLLLVFTFDILYFSSQLVWLRNQEVTHSSHFPWTKKVESDSKGNTVAEAARFFSWLQPGAVLIKDSGGEVDLSPEFSFWAGMQFDTPSYFQLSVPIGSSIFSPRPPVLRIGLEGEENRLKLLSIMSTKYFLVKQEGVPTVFLNLKALPKIFSPQEVLFSSGGKELISQLRDAKWNFQSAAILESPSPEVRKKGEYDFKLSHTWDEASLVLTAKQDLEKSWVIWNESWDPLWKANDFQGAITVVRANGWAMGFPIPALKQGEEYRIDLRYRDPYFYWGVCAAFVWLLLLVGSIFWKKFRYKAARSRVSI